MNDFEAYKLYISIKNHFTSRSYNHFKYQGKSKVNYNSFQKRKDKIFFQKLAKHSDIENFLIANFIVNNKLWIKNIVYSEESESIYKNWLKRNQAITYTIQQDLNNINCLFDDLIVIKEHEHPLLLKLYLRKEINLETLCIILDLTGCIRYWNKNMESDPIWDEVQLRVEKYTPFIKYDKDKIKKIIVDKFSFI